MVMLGSDSSVTEGKILSLAVVALYVNISHNVGTSLYLGVKPALTTLSEHAMHSIQSVKMNTQCD